MVFRENIGNSPIVIEGVTLVPHSIYVCVEGGEDIQVATALLETKSLGAGWNGSVAIDVVEPSSGQTYNVKFDRPQEIPLRARFTARSSTLNVQQIIPDAVSQYVNGELDGEVGLVVGANVSPFELAGAANIVEPRINITKVELSRDGLSWSTSEQEVLINQVARLPASAVTVVII
ncbi:MAG: hypothetical protein J6D44_13135, partial [Pseudomonas sp.]|nr:hypothetical protein [Pseudomonas sp.]